MNQDGSQVEVIEIPATRQSQVHSPANNSQKSPQVEDSEGPVPRQNLVHSPTVNSHGPELQASRPTNLPLPLCHSQTK